MLEILTAAEMKKADAAALATGTPAHALVSAAAAGLAQAVESFIPPCRVLFLCGKGYNGADGFVAAQMLSQKTGWQIRVACTEKISTLKGDIAEAAAAWQGQTENLNSNLPVHQTDLIVDAVFGTGFHGALPPELITVFDKIRAKNIPVIAADIPSGIDATTGTVAEGTLKAEATVIFCRKKIAHVLASTRAYLGVQTLAPLPVDDGLVAALGTSVFENHPALWLANFPFPAADAHKYMRGHVMVYGGPQRTGAACLAAHAAQVAGAGVVSIACTPDTRQIYSLYRASLMVDTWQNETDFKSLLRDERTNVVLLGSGGGAAGTDAEKLRAATLAALSMAGKTTVLDGDVFTVFKNDPDTLFKHLAKWHILTPHEGEFTRLFGDLPGSKVERARAAARKANAIIILKGFDTVIAGPEGTAVVNTNGTPILATAGSGDVLAGLVAGFAAQGMSSFMAALAAVWLHADAARLYGPGLTAEEIIININQSLKNILGTSQQNT
ncbi:MAG: NAD(P)H-hydrate dehydratase [Bdellovibrionales bacterium]|jgi:NAD(P)H-hydrate epimerase|nr:NAD(P)H-hydrate dehydratase [Bdellovibrionales bacterium]